MRTLIKYLNEIFRSFFEGNFSITFTDCVRCESKRLFLVSGIEGRSVRCINCRSTLISLSSLEVIKEIRLDKESASVYELSYHGAVFNYLKKNFKNFYFSEFFPSKAPGSLVDGIRNEDIQNLTFPSMKFDLVTSTEVFEHVENYRQGFSEVKRVLKSGGYFVFTVPLYEESATQQVCKINNYGELDWIDEPEFHDSRVSGINSVPVFWRHSKSQILNDLKDAGFLNAKLNKIDFNSQISQYVVLAQC